MVTIDMFIKNNNCNNDNNIDSTYRHDWRKTLPQIE